MDPADGGGGGGRGTLFLQPGRRTACSPASPGQSTGTVSGCPAAGGGPTPVPGPRRPCSRPREPASCRRMWEEDVSVDLCSLREVPAPLPPWLPRHPRALRAPGPVCGPASPSAESLPADRCARTRTHTRMHTRAHTRSARLPALHLRGARSRVCRPRWLAARPPPRAGKRGECEHSGGLFVS